MNATNPKIVLTDAATEPASQPSVRPVQLVRRASARPQYAKRLIDMAVADEELNGLSREILAALDPKHRDHRLSAHLIRRGLKEHELPDGRDYRRYFNGH